MADPTAAKRVAFFLPDLGGGGAERVALASMTDLVERGHQVDLVLVKAKGDLLQLVPPQVNVIDLNATRILASLPLLSRYLRKRKPDALHAVMWPVTIVAILAHRLARSRARLIVSDQVALSRQVHSPRQRAVLRWSTRLLYPLADVRIVCSALAADDLAALSGIPRERFEVIYNPISPPKVIASTLEVEALWSEGGRRIVTVGSLKEQKNHALLLRAFAKIRDRYAKLLILGEGPLRPLLADLATDLGIADRVFMPGFCVDPWPYLASADLFVLSSDYEGFPLVLAEAMQAGLKVVSTDCLSGPAELLDNGSFGRLVPCGDATALAEGIDAALDEPGDGDRMRARATAMAGPSMVARYSGILTKDDNSATESETSSPS